MCLVARAGGDISAKPWLGSPAPSHQGCGNNGKSAARQERKAAHAAPTSAKAASSCAVDRGGFGLVGVTASQGKATSSSSK